MSLPINEVIESLKRLAKLDAKTLIAIETDLEAKEAEKKEEAVAGPKAKNEFITILLDPEHKLVDGDEFTSLVLQIPEGQDAGTTLDRYYQSIRDQRAAAKRKPKVITSVADAADGVKRKFFKQNGIMVKTKTPVRVLVSDNTIPTN